MAEPHMKFSCNLSLIHLDDLLEIAPSAEENGFDTLLLGDHVVNPDVIDARYLSVLRIGRPRDH
jgi:alkanesulfonate monooxygenase SsuD/methylene tetrahydromethanopterin reductase-like flavin-dependent oxidoreductase (luciferase family)